MEVYNVHGTYVSFQDEHQSATTLECDVGTSDPTYLTHLKVGAVLHRLPNNTFLYGSQQFTSL